MTVISHLFHIYFTFISRLFHGYFTFISRLFHGYFTVISRLVCLSHRGILPVMTVMPMISLNHGGVMTVMPVMILRPTRRLEVSKNRMHILDREACG